MGVYRVTLKGVGIRATFDGKQIPCGFFKNEYVWATHADKAVGRALRKVEVALERDVQVVQNLSGLELSVEEVESGLGLAALFSMEGFVFYRLGDDEESSQV